MKSNDSISKMELAYHCDCGDKVEEDVVALRLLGHGVRVGDLQLVEGLQQEALALVLEVLERRLGGHQIGVPDDGPEESKIQGWAKIRPVCLNMS